MRITIKKERTVAEILSRIEKAYGSEKELRALIKRDPSAVLARMALHDLLEYSGEDPRKVIRETREIIMPDSSMDRLTVQRLQLLLALRTREGHVAGIRELARIVDRDVKNVSQDVHALEEIGLVQVADAAKGNPKKILLPGDSIDLHLVEAQT